MSSGASADAAAAFLRAHDRDRYLATLVLPPAVRAAAQAIYAFSADVAAVRDRVTAPTPGEIRLQWWRDALEGHGHGEVRQNPLADALLAAVGEFGLPVAPLIGLLEARRFDLYHDPMPDLPTFEGYAGATVSVLFQLVAMLLNGGRPVELGDAAGHLGVAQALIGHLRAFGHNAARGRIFLPLSILSASGVREDEIFSGTSSEGLVYAHEQLSDLAAEHLRKAAAAIGQLPRHLRPAFASLAVLRADLPRVAAAAETPFAPPPAIADWRKIAILAGWTLRNR